MLVKEGRERKMSYHSKADPVFFFRDARRGNTRTDEEIFEKKKKKGEGRERERNEKRAQVEAVFR